MASDPAPPSSLDAAPPFNDDAHDDVADDIDVYDDAPPDYNMADFRWVPVRRQPRYDGWTDEKQRRFIEYFSVIAFIGSSVTKI